ncbi:MAG: M36 family metallopeptidase [Saprospiraceae bacterium]|nr:M36 family metallopeptidase [Saprospiraceae bacterium]
MQFSMIRSFNLFAILFFLNINFCAFAQKQASELDIAFIKKNYNHINFIREEFEITAQYFDSLTNLRHIYLQQIINGLPIEGSFASLHFSKENELIHFAHQFVLEVKEKLAGRKHFLSELKALNLICQNRDISLNVRSFSRRNQNSKNSYKIFLDQIATDEQIEIKSSYYFMTDQNLLIPTYSIFWKRNKTNEWLQILQDAASGEIIKEVNLLKFCSFESGDFTRSNRFKIQRAEEILTNQSCYRVYPMPVESPIHGNRQVVMSPWMKAPDASPFGWHGDGLNFYYSSRGNNVDAYEDSDDDDMPTGGDLARAYGGPALNFDFPYDPSLPPFNNKDASITNLFYWTNLMHDVWHRYGFHEPSGNFQMNNFNKGGMGGDPILAQGLDNVYYARNNATFGTPIDGTSGIMQVYLWQFPIADTMIIESPPSIYGKYKFVHAPITPSIYAPVSKQIVLVQDVSSYPSYGCSNLTNTNALLGKIAMVDRGICSFTSKMSRIQSAGAVSVIVCNNEDSEPSGIGGWSYGLTIPAVMLSKADCQRIKLQLSNGVVGTLLPSSALKFGILQKSFIFSRAQFGKSIQNLNAPIVQVLDNVNNTMDACEFITNGFELNGKIALIEDGNCETSYKIMQVQNYGAVAAVLCKQGNGYPDIIPAGNYGHLINIPVIQISNADCQTIRLNFPVNAQFRNNTPALVDGTFDAGIICHEYGHGISTRLTGGPNNVSCLTNAEQMGEGWSDFFGLIMTIVQGDHAYKSRGMGTFSSCQGTSGRGIRPFPYHVSLTVNPADYNQLSQIATISQPHGIGYIWCSMLWDLVWAFVKQYGLEPDIYNVNSGKGNTKVYKLIIEAMKLQACNPGFVDARNAILKADTLLFQSANACLIWNVFARRGLGFNANQGSPYSRTDGIADYSVPVNCSYMSEKQLFELTLLASESLDLFATSGDQEIRLYWRSELKHIPQKISLFKKTGSDSMLEEIELTPQIFNQLSHVDLEVKPNEVYFYKLSTIGINGHQIESKWVRAQTKGGKQDWDLYPNPVSDYVVLHHKTSFSGMVNLKIFSKELKLIDQESILMHKNDHLQIDCSDLLPGLYLLSLETTQGIETLKFMKN